MGEPCGATTEAENKSVATLFVKATCGGCGTIVEFSTAGRMELPTSGLLVCRVCGGQEFAVDFGIELDIPALMERVVSKERRQNDASV